MSFSTRYSTCGICGGTNPETPYYASLSAGIHSKCYENIEKIDKQLSIAIKTVYAHNIGDRILATVRANEVVLKGRFDRVFDSIEQRDAYIYQKALRAAVPEEKLKEFPNLLKYNFETATLDNAGEAKLVAKL